MKSDCGSSESASGNILSIGSKQSDRETPYLSATDFCDATHASILELSEKLAANTQSPKQIAVRTFYWVRDNILYNVGHYNETASATLVHGRGSCTNKANLMVALLRANGIPSGYRVIRVKTRDYFGPIALDAFKTFVSEYSNHIFSSVKLGDQWIDTDSSDDRELSLNTQHLNSPSTLVDFDGSTHSVLKLAPETIAEDDKINHPHVDHILGKEGRIPTGVLTIFNSYVDFMRKQGRNYQSITSLHNDFLGWVSGRYPREYSTFRAIEQQILAQNGARDALQSSR